jgi:hypothetical protein
MMRIPPSTALYNEAQVSLQSIDSEAFQQAVRFIVRHLRQMGVAALFIEVFTIAAEGWWESFDVQPARACCDALYRQDRTRIFIDALENIPFLLPLIPNDLDHVHESHVIVVTSTVVDLLQSEGESFLPAGEESEILDYLGEVEVRTIHGGLSFFTSNQLDRILKDYRARVRSPALASQFAHYQEHAHRHTRSVFLY